MDSVEHAVSDDFSSGFAEGIYASEVNKKIVDLWLSDNLVKISGWGPDFYRSLTFRQKKIVILLCRGVSQRGIARCLSVSPQAVGGHLKWIKKKIKIAISKIG